MNSIPYSRQQISEEDIAAVCEVLRSDFLTQGPVIPQFEQEFSHIIGSQHAVAVANGTAALHLACLALQANSDTVVYTTPITFAASANCALYCGASVKFIDIDSDNYCLDLNSLEDQLKSSDPKQPKIVITVDFAGYPVDLDKLRTLKERYNFKIIEDACHAPGGYFIDSSGIKRKCGDCTLADLAIFSFHPVKHIACGEGGMVTTNNPDLYKQIVRLRTHGITKSPDELQQNPGIWYYEMQDLGYNYRLTDMQAALGLSQLRKLESGNRRRHELAETYNQQLAELPLQLPQVEQGVWHAYHLYVVQCDQRNKLYEYLRSQNIICQVHYIPVNSMPYYQALGHSALDTPRAWQYYQRCLSLPMFPSLTDKQQAYVIEQVKIFFNEGKHNLS